MRQTRTRTRRRSLGFIAALLLAGGCGGGGESAPPPPRIEAATAERLATASDSIADLLDAGDVCGAAGRADELLEQVVEAINAGAVPPRYHEELSAKANELVNEVNCPPPTPASPPDEEEDDDGNGKDKDKDDKQDDGEEGEDEEEDEPPIEVPPPPTVTTP